MSAIEVGAARRATQADSEGPSGPGPGADTDRELAELLLGLVRRIAKTFDELAQGEGFTRSQVNALLVLDEPCSQRELATSLHLDTSNITGIVDRLESEGLVARSMNPSDRRVRQVARTEAGERFAAAFIDRILGTVPAVVDLPPEDKDTLRTLLRRFVKPEGFDIVRRGPRSSDGGR